MESIFYQSHAGSWAFLILFFLISYFFSKQKITLMLQRLFAVIMIVTGIGMWILYGFPMFYLIKGILAILLIGIMEMLVGRKKRQQSHGGMWAGFIILALIVLLMGYNVIG
ncbi:DUF1516 family protein [Alteribacillus iranensis]|uniref:Uncharacterized protein n=1 Tax=Alteribacillus iranensis TaxID=930128 RepID=A0A1I2DHV1_9BACI|nr:DUF1516 family protein [Alteribacillus iranensis]SFE79931.1 Protein of unknown function [Alteribacillus iranensis]